VYEENMVYASLVDGYDPHCIVIEDGVHLGHGVFVSTGTRVRRGAILGDYTVAQPDRHFPPHSVTQVQEKAAGWLILSCR
jgi:acetyltransferase-like isoleucine patch superfamily enzyme